MLKLNTTPRKQIQNTVNIVFAVAGNFFVYVSFLSVLALTMDRFLAIHFHLRYQQVVTYRRAVVLVITLFVISALLASIGLWFSQEQRRKAFIIQTVFEIICLIIVAILYWKIFSTARHHRRQIQTLQVRENGEEKAMVARRFKLAVSTFWVYLVFVGCYLPDICIIIIFATSAPSKTMSHFLFYSWTVVLFNSSLNPLIYCRKMRHMRQAVLNICRKYPFV